MPKSKAEGREKWILLSTPPADPAAVTLDEASAGIDASCAISSAEFADQCCSVGDVLGSGDL